MMSSKESSDVMRNYLNLNIDELLQEVNTIPDLIDTSDEEVQYLGTRQAQSNSNLNIDELTQQVASIEIDCHPSKRRRIQVYKFDDLVTLPATSLQDLFSTKKRKLQVKRRPLKHETYRFEGTKIEANLEKPIKLTIPARNCSSRLPPLPQYQRIIPKNHSVSLAPVDTSKNTIPASENVNNERDIQDNRSILARNCLSRLPTPQQCVDAPLSANLENHSIPVTLLDTIKNGISASANVTNGRGIQAKRSPLQQCPDATLSDTIKTATSASENVTSERDIQATRSPLKHGKRRFEGTKCEDNLQTPKNLNIPPSSRTDKTTTSASGDVIRVTSDEYLFSTNKREIQAKGSPLEHEKHRFERTKCEANLQTPINSTIPARNCSSRLSPLQKCPDAPLSANLIVHKDHSIPLTPLEAIKNSTTVRANVTNERCIQAKRRPLKQRESLQCEANLQTLSDIIKNATSASENVTKERDTQAQRSPLKANLQTRKKRDIQAKRSPLQQCPDATLSDTTKNATPATENVTNERDIKAKSSLLQHGKDRFERTKCQANRKKRNVSLVERFTEEEIKLHIMSLDKGSSKILLVPPSGNREMCDLKDKDEECQLCCEIDLMFPPPPIYCSLCSLRIKEEASYYIPEEEISNAQICNTCYNRSRSKFKLSGIIISKPKMLKKNNTHNKTIEEWVQCEACKKWQHQICGLYNKLKDIEETAEYICPHCLLKERNRRFDDNTDLRAKDLPKTFLSYFIEQRLFKRLKEERVQTAKASEKSIHDVQEPKDLTLRVVYSADKTSTVNKEFADFFHEEHFPSEFPYRSKVILLFQKLEGVDVLLFAFFVQEFGSECDKPNQRTVYISYMDSVKYFRPERATFAGEALRTFVFHEILIAYLAYCKIRGFTTSYIWSSPPSKGEDYIMNSHPKTQQTPSIKKLRQWYLSMLDKAMEERIVKKVTNLYDRFFITTCNNRVAKLPYFEGSCWSDRAQFLIQEIERLSKTELQKKVKSVSTRTMSYKTRSSIVVDEAKKILLTQQLEEMILKNKEDLLVVELNHSCTRCSKAISSEVRWVCKKCKNLQLCQRCYDAKRELPNEHKHSMKGKEKHWFSKMKMQSTTEDGDDILKTDMFESRQEFLSFCQKNNYNFDTLRRAKHSSMMILHHLHHTSNKLHCSENSSHVTKISVAADMLRNAKKWGKTKKRGSKLK